MRRWTATALISSSGFRDGLSYTSGPSPWNEGSGTQFGARCSRALASCSWAAPAGARPAPSAPAATSSGERKVSSTSSIATTPRSRTTPSPSSSSSRTQCVSPGVRCPGATTSLPRLSACHWLALKTSSSSLSVSCAMANSNWGASQTGLRLFSTTSVLNSWRPRRATTKGSDTSPSWMPRSVFRRLKARRTRSLSLPPAMRPPAAPGCMRCETLLPADAACRAAAVCVTPREFSLLSDRRLPAGTGRWPASAWSSTTTEPLSSERRR
mmetsp:Transcript_63539/g.165147  ORF Transcript_63539/g.165147 Transcript_63539/m.165147 type:complete len:268 (+) Transcript_63539:1831-2634(+)